MTPEATAGTSLGVLACVGACAVLAIGGSALLGALIGTAICRNDRCENAGGALYDHIANDPDNKPKPFTPWANEPPISTRDEDRNQFALYHYTTVSKGMKIAATGVMYSGAGLQGRRGQFFTDISPRYLSGTGQPGREALASILWGPNGGPPRARDGYVDYALKIDVSGLPLVRDRDHVYRVPGEGPLFIGDRLLEHGPTPR